MQNKKRLIYSPMLEIKSDLSDTVWIILIEELKYQLLGCDDFIYDISNEVRNSVIKEMKKGT